MGSFLTSKDLKDEFIVELSRSIWCDEFGKMHTVVGCFLICNFHERQSCPIFKAKTDPKLFNLKISEIIKPESESMKDYGVLDDTREKKRARKVKR